MPEKLIVSRKISAGDQEIKRKPHQHFGCPVHSEESTIFKHIAPLGRKTVVAGERRAESGSFPLPPTLGHMNTLRYVSRNSYLDFTRYGTWRLDTKTFLIAYHRKNLLVESCIKCECRDTLSYPIAVCKPRGYCRERHGHTWSQSVAAISQNLQNIIAQGGLEERVEKSRKRFK